MILATAVGKTEREGGGGRLVVHTFGKGRNNIVSLCRQHGLLHRPQKLQKKTNRLNKWPLRGI